VVVADSAVRHLLEIVLKFKNDPTGIEKADQNLKQFLNNLQAVGKQMVAVGAAITAALGLMTKAATNYASQLDATSKRTGLAVDELAKLGYAAEMEHANLQKLEMSFRYFTRTINQAKNGTGQAADEFARLGIQIRNQEVSYGLWATCGWKRCAPCRIWATAQRLQQPQ